MRNIIINQLFFFLVIVLSACNIETEKTNKTIVNTTPIMGTWEMTSIHWITKDTTYSIKKAQPGIFMFTPKRYAIMWIPTEEARTPFQNLSEPTIDEIKSGFRSIVFNSGTYEFSDSTITATAEIAKVPGFENGKQFYRYKIQNDEMEITMFDELYPNGKRPQWFGKYKTKFVMKKIE